MRNLFHLSIQAIRVISRRGRLYSFGYAVSLVVLSLLDAVALLVLTRIINRASSDSLDSLTLRSSVGPILLIVTLFVLRSLCSSAVSFLVIVQLAREETILGEANYNTLTHPLTQVTEPMDSLLPDAVDRGPQGLMMIIFTASTLLGEALTALVIMIALITLNPLSATIAIAYFSTVVLVQHQILASRSRLAGERSISSITRTYELLADAAALRQVLLDARGSSLQASLQIERHRLTRARGETQFLALAPRYFMEITLIVGVLVVASITYSLRGEVEALASVSLFSVAGFRLLPVINRVQALLLALFSWAPASRLGLGLTLPPPSPVTEPPRSSTSVIEFEYVSIRYLGSERDALRDISLTLDRGRQYAVAGPSGAGKTTLALAALGLLPLRSGVVRRSPDLRCAFIPQQTHIAHTSLMGNVAMTWNRCEADVERVEWALQEAGLAELISQLDNPNILSNESLSGGQKQRIGLARAFYVEADFIVFDEVTSALDSAMESFVVETIAKLRGRVSTLIIAHRLTTIKAADHIYYISGGRLTGSGSFVELAATNPEFHSQVRLSQLIV